MQETYRLCAEIIKNSEVMFIHTGAGMGIDSGLPDFRGAKGFWNCYPLYEKLGINFIDAANPEYFKQDPSFAWGFYGHRTSMYRNATPHEGFHLLKKWTQQYNLPYFNITSNVDGQFQKAGFCPQQIYEIHGSILHLQCLDLCCENIWDNKHDIEIDFETMRSKELHKCIYCEGIARPNILMFGDWDWIPHRSDAQGKRMDEFEKIHRGKRAVIIEIGAGTAIPSIRLESWKRGNVDHATIIRINPHEPQIEQPHISVPKGGLEALRGIDEALQST